MERENRGRERGIKYKLRFWIEVYQGPQLILSLSPPPSPPPKSILLCFVSFPVLYVPFVSSITSSSLEPEIFQLQHLMCPCGLWEI